jgi:NTE family protein
VSAAGICSFTIFPLACNLKFKKDKSMNEIQSGTKKKRVGLAFQGGSFLAGAVHTGVVRALIKQRVFAENYELQAFSGTSAGALVAAVCWSLALESRFEQADEILTKFWLHNANSLIPTQELGDFWRDFDNAARKNAVYDKAAEMFRTPWLHDQFRQWITTYLDCDKAIRALYAHQEDPSRPRLALGSADVLEGEIVTFDDDDFLEELNAVLAEDARAINKAYEAGSTLMLDALMASGSLDEINGTTSIKSPLHKGTYLDGAWGENPPIDAMIEFGVDEIWLVEIFPKLRLALPETHAQREDRKEELWQNSLVEQQVHMIRKVNEWLDNDSLKPKDNDKIYRHIEVRRIPMTLDFTPGARIVNSPSFLHKMMDYGYENALHFLSGIPQAGVPLPSLVAP